MTKKELIEDAALFTRHDTKLTGEILEGILSEIKTALACGNNIYIRGFGTFAIVKQSAKVGQNITKGTAVNIPARNVVKFKPSKEFKAKGL